MEASIPLSSSGKVQIQQISPVEHFWDHTPRSGRRQGNLQKSNYTPGLFSFLRISAISGALEQSIEPDSGKTDGLSGEINLFSNRINWLPTISLLTATVMWASSFIALKLAFRSFDPMFVIFGRMAVASVCFLFFLPRFLKRIDYRKGDILRIAFMALCEPCLYFIFEARAIENTTASQAGMISATLPLIMAVVAWIFLKEHISRRMVAGFFVAILGVCWLSISAKSSENAPNPVLGNFLEFMAMVCATGYIATCKYLTARYSPFFLTALQAFIGSVFFLLLTLFPTISFPTVYEPTATAAVIYLGAGATLVAYGCYNFGVSKLPASQAGAFINLIPVFTIIMAWLILGEKFSFMQYLGAATVFAGVILSQDSTGRKPVVSDSLWLPMLKNKRRKKP